MGLFSESESDGNFVLAENSLNNRVYDSGWLKMEEDS